MNRADQEMLREVTRTAISMELGSLSDLPYDLANAVANVYYRYFEMGVAATPAVSVHESDKRLVEYQSISAVITQFRALPHQGAHPSVVEYVMNHLLDHFKHRIPDAERKMPILCRMQRLFYPGQDIPNLVRKLELY